MDNEAVKHLWALFRVNKALVRGLKAAVSALETAEEVSPERRQDLIDSLKDLISQNENLTPHEPKKGQT
jgi:hypothetical protein